MSEQVLTELNSFEVNENFISPGHLHVGLCYGPDGKPKEKCIYVESIEVIGGAVFLGTRHVFNYKSDESDYTITDSVLYENLNVFISLQRVKAAKQRDNEIQEWYKKIAKEQEDLKKQGEKNESENETETQEYNT